MAEESLKNLETSNKSYKIIDTLGEGGTSIVYLANDGKRDIALKILGEVVDPAFKDQYVKILKNEFEVLTSLKHPNIAEVYDFEYAPSIGKYFFTTEYVKGSDVYNYTDGMDIKAKEDLFVQLLLALDHVHRSGVIHCDIKCGNALVTQVKGTSMLKLVDFGFATRKLATKGDVIGTIQYLAPELLVKERKDVDHKIDIYAAGVVLYRLLHRAYPYKATTINDILKWHREGAVIPFSNEVPEYLKQLIMRMMATIPTERIASCAKAVEFVNFRTEGRYKKLLEKVVGLQFREGPLVGRNEVLGRMINILTDIRSGKSPESSGLIVSGQQGIGKTRLFRELKYRAEVDEVPIKEFVCFESKDLVSEFVSQFKEIPREMPDGTAVTEDKQKLMDVSWINCLIERYNEKGLVIVIDDLQLSDSAFIKFLMLMEDRIKVKRSEGKVPIIFFVGIRPKAELSEVVSKWYDRSDLPKVELPTLSRADMEDYIKRIGIGDFKKYLEQTAAFSGGVPGLVEAYCQHIFSPAGSSKPPASLAQSYLERAKHLSKKAFLCLEYISVARRNLDLNDIEELTKINKNDLQSRMKELVLNGFVINKYPSMDVSVTNKAIAQAVRASLESERFKELSREMGSYVEKKDPGALAELAEYFSDANVGDRAQCYAESAARYFEERFNNSEASKFYELALKYVTDEGKKRTFIRSASKTSILMGSFKNSVARLNELISSGDENLENYRLLGMAHAKMHDYDNARKWYELGLGKTTSETPVIDIIQFKNSLGNVFFYMKDLEESERYFTEAIADATERLLLNNNLGLILSSKGNYEQALQFYDNRKKFLAAKNNKRALSLCYAECGYIHMNHNRILEAISDLEESYRLASDMGDWYNILVIIGNLVRCYQQTAQYSKALDYALKGQEVEVSVGSIEEIAQNHLTIGILYETIGDTDLSVQHVNMAKDRFTALNDRSMLGWCHLSMGFIYRDIGKLGESAKEFELSEKISEEMRLDDLAVWAKYSKADLLAESGKIKEAALLVNKMPNITSTEFVLRRKLLEMKLGLVPEGELEKRFNDLVNECQRYPELIWETYAAYAEHLEKSGKIEEANAIYRKSYEAIESIARNLSEAYRDSYRSQRSRLKVVRRFKPDYYSKSIKVDELPDNLPKEFYDGKTKNI